jgi:hypothetical protein
MKVEKLGMVVFGILEKKGIEPGLLVVPVYIGKASVWEGSTEVKRKRNIYIYIYIYKRCYVNSFLFDLKKKPRFVIKL